MKSRGKGFGQTWRLQNDVSHGKVYVWELSHTHIACVQQCRKEAGNGGMYVCMFVFYCNDNEWLHKTNLNRMGLESRILKFQHW